MPVEIKMKSFLSASLLIAGLAFLETGVAPVCAQEKDTLIQGPSIWGQAAGAGSSGGVGSMSGAGSSSSNNFNPQPNKQTWAQPITPSREQPASVSRPGATGYNAGAYAPSQQNSAAGLRPGAYIPAQQNFPHASPSSFPSWETQQLQNQQMQNAALAAKEMQPQSPGALKLDAWKREWMQQHPGEPVPTGGALEKMHRAEILQTMNQDFAQMRANRQAALQRDYLRAKTQQQQELAARHVTWSSAQWQNWDREYDQGQRQNAQDYLNGVKQVGDMEREERRRLYGF